VSETIKVKTCGREPSCALVLDHPTISRLHAHIELASDGLVSVRDAASQNGTFLHRNDRWIRVRKSTLCIGDRIRFGDVEVSLERLTAIFGPGSDTRLEAKHFPPRQVIAAAGDYAGRADHGPLLTKPRRNPVTGKIEENHSRQRSADKK
jgi:pSer/pThr/pTyr-binding forkhead associated (FHA) protein